MRKTRTDCPQCGAVCWQGSGACDLCGSSLSGDPTKSGTTRVSAPESRHAKDADPLRCAHCGVSVEPDSNFCHECGRRAVPAAPHGALRRMNGDYVLLRERGVVVTKTRLLVVGRAYELAKISSVDQERGNSPIGIPLVGTVVLVIGLGVWLGLAGLEGPSYWRLGLAVILVLAGLYIAYASSAPKHVLIVRLGDIRDEALTSTDAEFIRRVADAVTRAIASKD